MSIGKQILIVLALIIVSVGAWFGSGYLTAAYESTAGQAIENAQTQKFIHNKTFIMGKVQQATKYYNEWRKAEDIEKKTIEQLMLTEMSMVEIENFQEPVKSWIQECRTKIY